MIFIHELGHFTFAKLTGMKVERFSVGFPPRLIGKKIGDTDYCISAIPLGGYVKVAGAIDESLDKEGAQGDEPWKYESKKNYQKMLYIIGGVLFNLLLAIVIFSLLTLAGGIYKASPEAVIDEVISEMPAEAAGIKPGDRILEIDGNPVASWDDLTRLIHAHPNDSITVTWSRGAERYHKTILTVSNKILKDGQLVDVGIIGISPVLHHHKAGLFEATGRGIGNTWYWLKVTVISLKMLVTGQESLKNIGGPIFIAKLAGQSARSGLGSLFGLMAIISVNLALINVLPIPALDGGHLIIVLVESGLRRPLSLQAKIRIQQVGLAIILMLMAIVFYNDIARLFHNGM